MKISVPLLADPGAAAVLCDLDGTLAPIVDRPEDAVVPRRARAALEPIADRYALSAIVTGRRAAAAREIVGLDGLTYVGIHGFELLHPGEEAASPSPALRGHEDDARRFADGLWSGELDGAGIRVEDKGPIVALHWRGAGSETEALELLERIAGEARATGLVAHRGRKVLELRPAVRIDKGLATGDLLVEVGARAALYAGDDRTDLDAFRALARLRDDGTLEAAVRVGVRSSEGPSEIVTESDLIVEGPEEMPPLLEILGG